MGNCCTKPAESGRSSGVPSFVRYSPSIYAIPSAPPADTGPSTECCICCETYPAPAFPSLHPDATHAATVCHTCFERHCETEIGGKQEDKVMCPVGGCGTQLQAHWLPTQKLRDGLAKNQTLAFLRTKREFCWCAHPNCGNGQLHDGGADAPVVVCQQCRRETCFVHNVPFHSGITCRQYDAAQGEDNDIRWVQEHCKRCPKCNHAIEKNKGCDHMTCDRTAGGCGHEFCWLCLADFAAVRRDGNHAHQPTCMHWRDPGRA